MVLRTAQKLKPAQRGEPARGILYVPKLFQRHVLGVLPEYNAFAPVMSFQNSF